MSDKKPSVFPTDNQIAQANDTGQQMASQLQEENNVVTNYGSDLEAAAAAEMRKRTEEQVTMREEMLRKNEEIAKQMDDKRASQSKEQHPYTQPKVQSPVPPVPPTPPSNNDGGELFGGNSNKPSTNAFVEVLSQPQMNQPFDVIPLPSEGKLYPNKKKSVKVAYLTTADENILTSPNLVESGEFLEILINRKLLEPDLRYENLLPGDRNAIMLWLRATGYGEIYPIMVYDENDKPFESEVNLSQLKTINLSVDPDSEGLFSFNLPTSNMNVKFKILSVGELDALEEYLESNKDNPINEEQTMALEAQIVEFNGSRDRREIKDYVTNMRLMDAKGLRDYMGTIECGVDMTITVGTPGGESITTFLPITPRFFWPNSQL
jgi:hypothetical protein